VIGCKFDIDFVVRRERHEKDLIIRMEGIQDVSRGFIELILHRPNAAAPVQNNSHCDRRYFQREVFNRFRNSILNYFEIIGSQVQRGTTILIFNEDVELPEVHVDDQVLRKQRE
jgi:hypothetical protein